MNTILIFLICIVIIAALCFVIYTLFKNIKSLKKEVSKLTSDLYKANQNATELANYITELQKIKSDEKSTDEKIKEAETDEEIMGIISGLVNANNSRLCD